MEKIGGVLSSVSLPNINTKSAQTENITQSFSSILTDAIEKVNTYQNESKALTDQLVTGQIEDIHQVMIAAQKASLSLQLTVQVRNKVVESYQEIMRMQV